MLNRLVHILLLLVAMLMQLLLSCCHAQQPEAVAPAPLRVGAEVLLSKDYAIVAPTRVGVVANQSSLVGKTHLVDTLVASGVDVVKIFCPEHGFRGNAEAGATVSSGIDPGTGLPVVSLYGKNKKPTPEQMSDIDAVIFDLQDVGCRFYTYISTLHYVMEACAERGIPCIVLDRPNPNCHYVDGPVLDMKYQSFIGMHPVPIVYGLTIGEYATMINGEHWLKGGVECDLTVVAMEGYRRDSSYVLPVPPSPNLPTPQSILLYPSLCLFEGTNISVGRGTDTPFEIIGSPEFHIDSDNSLYTVGDNKVPSIRFTPHPIKGASENPPFNWQRCQGLYLRNAKTPAKFDLGWMLVMFAWTPHDSFFKKSNSFEKLAGNDHLRNQIRQGMSEDEIRASWEPALSEYKQMRKKYLLYPDIN